MVTEATGFEQPGTGQHWPSAGEGSHFYLSTPELNQRLDLLQHLTANSDRIALVKGPEGIGKTALVERFQALAADHWRLCRIDANPMLQPDQLFAILANCFALPKSEERLSDRLLRHFEHLRQAGELPVIVIDDAHLLPVTSIISLLRLYELRPARQALVRLILFATQQIDDLLATPQAMAMNLQALQVLELPPLGAKQTEQLAQHRLASQGLGDKGLSDSQLAKIYNDTAGVPGEIVKRVDRLGQRMSNTLQAGAKSTGRSRLTLAGAVMIGIALLAILIFQDSINDLFVGEPAPRDTVLSPVEREAVVPLQLPDIGEETLPPHAPEPEAGPPDEHREELPALVSQGSGLPELSLPEVQTRADQGAESVIDAMPVPGGEAGAAADPTQFAPSSVDEADTQEEPVRPAPQSVVHETPTVQTEEQSAGNEQSTAAAAPPQSADQALAKQPPPSAAVDTEEDSGSALAQPSSTDATAATSTAVSQTQEPAKPATAQAESASGPSSVELATSSSGEEKEATDQRVTNDGVAQGRVVSVVSPEPVQKPASIRPVAKKPKREAWLRRQQPSAYTLQLLGVQQEAAVHSFLQRHRLPGETAYFRTQREGRPWFSVVYGIYPDRAAAVAARAGLPAAVRDGGVWPRSLASIQEAIGPD